MKITMNIQIDATPKEVRETLGLPDVQAVQERIIARAEKKVMDGLASADPLKLMSIFLPEGFGLPDGVQKLVLGNLPKALQGGKKKAQ